MPVTKLINYQQLKDEKNILKRPVSYNLVSGFTALVKRVPHSSSQAVRCWPGVMGRRDQIDFIYQTINLIDQYYSPNFNRFVASSPQTRHQIQ